ncbi:hypothetical protein BJX61DRAFT_508650 [Aspergillus egyptiacus]|nr:hypothetical protein BJX61DRAFT_508650 [Aspergillus egyptiacus]
MAPRQTEKSFLSATYEQLTSPENTTIVRSILVFGVRTSCRNSSYGLIFLFGRILTLFLQAGVAFLHSSLSELLLPP